MSPFYHAELLFLSRIASICIPFANPSGMAAQVVSVSYNPVFTKPIFWQVIKDLGKRHVTYGVASHHVPVMKQVSFKFTVQIASRA